MDFEAEARLVFVPTVDVAYEPAVVVPRVLTARQCDRVVELGVELDAEAARVGATEAGSGADAETRRSRTAWIPYQPDTAWIYDKLAAAARRANRVYAFDLAGFTEDVQFTSYDEPGAFFDWHADGLAGEVAGRKLSLVAQLSDPDDYRGGELEVFAVGAEGGPDAAAEWSERAHRRGTVVAFPSFAHHRVRPLRRGVRRSLVCWVGGPPFR